MKIGQVAEQAGVTIDTVRFYERRGVLPAPNRTPSGYRVYEASTVERIRFTRALQHLGFTLGEAIMRCAVTTPARQHANQSCGECRPSSTASIPRSPNCRRPAGMSAKRWMPANKDIAGSADQSAALRRWKRSDLGDDVSRSKVRRR